MGHMSAYDKKTKCFCGREFWAARRTAKYCSATCRKAAQRDRNGIQPAAKKVIAAVMTINGYVHDKDDKVDMQARRTLKELRDLIDSLLYG